MKITAIESLQWAEYPRLLVVRVHTDDLRLEWFDSAGRQFAADVYARAYTYDRAGEAVQHYM